MKSEELKMAAVLAALVIVVGAIALAAAGRLQIGAVVDVDTIGLEQNCGIVGGAVEASVRGFGRFPDPSGDTRLRGELFSTSRLWYSWFKDGESRPVALESRIEDCGLAVFQNDADSAFYAFDYSEDGRTWITFHQDRIPTGRVVTITGSVGEGFLGAFELIIDGFTFCKVDTTNGCPANQIQDIKDGSALRVSSMLQRSRFPAWGPVVIVQDQIELRSAVPEIIWDRAGYTTGETATVNFEIPTTIYTTCSGSPPTCTSSPAYFLEILDMNTNAPLLGFDRLQLTKTSGRFSILLTDALISKDLATCQNRLRASIWTTIIRADLEDTAIRAPDVSITGGPAPRITGITFDKREYQEGDTVKISWTSEGTVTKYHVTAHIGGLVVLEKDLDPTHRDESFIAPRTGVLEVQVTGYNLCTTSDVKKEQATVGNVFPGLCEIYPDLAVCTGRQNLASLIIAALAVIGILAIFVLVFWIGNTVQGKKGSPLISLLAALVIGGILAVVLITQGALDPLLGASA